MADPLLASDDDREQALVLLRSASVDGRLTVEDLAARADLVHAARTTDEIAAAARCRSSHSSCRATPLRAHP